MSSVFDWIVRRHHSRHQEQNPCYVISKTEYRTNMNCNGSRCDLVKTVVENLPQWTTVVSPSSLFTIHCVDSLKPKGAEKSEEPNPAWQDLIKRGINKAEQNNGHHREHKSQNCQHIWSQPVRQAMIRDKVPIGLIEGRLHDSQPTCLIPKLLYSFDVLLLQVHRV